MIVSLKLLGSKQIRTFKIEDPEHISLARLSSYYFSLTENNESYGINSKGDKTVEYLFYSKAENGFLNPYLPLSSQMIANEDLLLIIPSKLKDHLNPFEQPKEIEV